MFINCVPKITITKIISANRILTSPLKVTVKRDNRNQWGLVLKTSGKTYYTINDKEILSDCFHPVILPKGCSYSWKCIEPGECIIIEFDAAETYNDIFSFELSDSNYILNTFLKIEKLLNFKETTTQWELMHTFYGILVFLAKASKKGYITQQKQELIELAMHHITENYQNCALNNQMLAQLCGMSTDYFRKTFEKMYGISPIKYLHNFRIKKAKAILQSDYVSISQIAESVGYSNIYHFSKMFKTYTGMNPSEYANQRRK